MSRKNITSMDIFSGSGGLSLGLELAGIFCVGAIEMDRFAAETYSANFPETQLYRRRVEEFSSAEVRNYFGGVDIIAAGPPCQGFSVAGPSQYGKIDKRNQLLIEVERFVKVLQPSVVIIENVKGLLNGKLDRNRKALSYFIKRMEDLSYYVSCQVLQAADFGVPQWRERVFVFATRGRQPFPNVRGTYGSEANPWRSGKEGILDLPHIKSGQGDNMLVSYTAKPTCPYQRQMRRNSKGVTNHLAMNHTPRLIERFQHIPIGGSLVGVPQEHGQRVRNGKALDVRQRFKMNNQRLDPNKISLAITASFQSNFVHPFIHRNLTAREGARLQSFPDWFVFKGPRTLMSRDLLLREERLDEIGLSQYNQIGNAVPPLVAKAIGQHVRKFLESSHYDRSRLIRASAHAT